VSPLAVAVIILAVLVLTNLSMTFAAVRRLHEHGEGLSARPDGLPAAAELVGRSVPDVTVVTVDGVKVTAEQLRDRPWLIGFFSVTCQPCRQQAPLFAAASEADRLAVVITDGATDVQRDELVALLAGAPYIVTESGLDGLSGGLDVRMFPILVRTDETGTVIMADASMQSLPR
jgi:hypothetical protein